MGNSLIFYLLNMFCFHFR